MIGFKMYVEQENPPEVVATSDNQKVELTKAQEFELSKQSNLPTKMKLGVYDFKASIHAQARATQRRSKLTAADWKALARKIAHYVEDNKIRTGTYMFYDKPTGESVACRVRNREIEIITIYPRGAGSRVSAKQAAAGVQGAIMEVTSVSDVYELDNINEMLDEILALTGSELNATFVLE